MAGLYIGSTTGYSGKNMIVMGLGLRLQKEGFNVGYMKPVGAMPMEVDGKLGDEDAAFVQDVLGVSEDPEAVTPVVVTQDFKVKAFTGKMEGLLDKIVEGYKTVSDSKDVTLVAGSGSMYSGKYCDTDAISVVKKLGIKTVIIDRSRRAEIRLPHVMKEQLATCCSASHDIPPSSWTSEPDARPALEARRQGSRRHPRDPLMAPSGRRSGRPSRRQDHFRSQQE